jgi:hypothetical protein
MREMAMVWSAAMVGLAIAFIVIAVPASAYRPGGQRATVPITIGATVGVASAQAIGADAQRSALLMCNASSTATVFWSHASFGPAVMNAAGSVPLLSQACFLLDGTKDTDAVNMIASAAATPVTIIAWD